ncbi:uncharacterized protein V1513DRAFT_276490 [Lipomyces chichibuensis]|uniref:uncharacterized protein n=1 Tax=Lipomyces chichibuensis TaxID=1546026 RepID=UPI003343EC46
MELHTKSGGTNVGRKPSTLRKFLTRTFSRRKLSKQKQNVSVIFTPQAHIVDPTVSTPKTDVPDLGAQTSENQGRRSYQEAVGDTNSKEGDRSTLEIDKGARTPPWSCVHVPAENAATILLAAETAEFGCSHPKKLDDTMQTLKASKLSSMYETRLVASPVVRSRNDTLRRLWRGADSIKPDHGPIQERETQTMRMTTQYGDWDEFMDCYARGQYCLGTPPPPPRGRPNFKYFVPPVPPNEERRLVEVAKYDIAYSPEFSTVCSNLLVSARKSFGLRGASISLLTEEAQVVKAEIGLNRNVIDRKISLEANTILSLEPIIITNTLLDWRFAKNPLVINFPSIGFWASAPIISPVGHPIGAFSIWDAYPREGITIAQRRQLQGFADAAMNELEREHSRRMSPKAIQNIEADSKDDGASMYSAEEFDYPDAPRAKRKNVVVDSASDKDVHTATPYCTRRVANIDRRRSTKEIHVLALPMDQTQEKIAVCQDQKENTTLPAVADIERGNVDLALSPLQDNEELRVTFRTQKSQEGASEDSHNWLSDFFDGDGQARYSSALYNRIQRLFEKEQLFFADSSSIESFSRLPRSPALPFYRRTPFRELTNTYSFLAILAKVAAISLGLDVAYFIEVGKSTSSDEHHAELDRLLYGDILGSPAPPEKDPVDGLRLSKRLLAAYGIMRDDPDFDAKLHYRALDSQYGLAYHNSAEESSSYYGILIPFRRYFENTESLRSTSNDKLSTEVSSSTNSRASSNRISSSHLLQPFPHVSQSASSRSNSDTRNMAVNSSNTNLTAINQDLFVTAEVTENLSTSSVATMALQSRSQTPNVINVSLSTDTLLPIDISSLIEDRQTDSNSQGIAGLDVQPARVATTSPMKASPRTVRLQLPGQAESEYGPASADSASTVYTDRTSQSIANRSTPATSVNVSPLELAKPLPIAVLPTPSSGVPQDDVPTLLRAKSIDSRMNIWNQVGTGAEKPIKLTIDTTGNRKFSRSQTSAKPVMTMLDIRCQSGVSESYYTSVGATTGPSSCLTSAEEENEEADAVVGRFQCDGGIVFGGFSAAKKEYSQSDMEFIDKFKALVNEGIEWIR